MDVYEAYRQIVMAPPSRQGKEKTLVQLITDAIKQALAEDRKGRKKRDKNTTV